MADKMMKSGKALILSVALLCLSFGVVVADSTITNGLVPKVKAILPADWEIQYTQFSPSGRSGQFGSVDHFYIALNHTNAFRLGLRKLHINRQYDACLIFLPASYAYPDRKTEEESSQYFVVRNETHQVFLFPPYYERTTWESMKSDVVKAFKPMETANKPSHHTAESRAGARLPSAGER